MPTIDGLRPTRIGRRRFTGLVAGAVATTGSGLLLPRFVAAQKIEPMAKPGESVGGERVQYFAETGHNLQEPFLSRWTETGGVNIFGVPLSEQRFVEGAGTVHQTFETVTMVYDPSLDAPWDVQAVHLGDDLVRELAPAQARTPVGGCQPGAASCRYFADSGHTLAGGFATFWQRHGGLQLFGLPRSEQFRADGVITQVFERAVIDQTADGRIAVRKLATISPTDDPAFQPTPPTGGQTSLVSASDGLRLRDAPGGTGEVIAVLPDNAEFIAAPGDHGEWVPGYVDGYAGWVSATYLRKPKALPEISKKDWNQALWQGAALGETNVRQRPSTNARITRTLAHGDPIKVVAWVKGEEVFEGADEWAKLDDDTFVYSRNVGRSAPVAPTPIPDGAPAEGRWFDVNLTQQLMVAYEGRNPIRTFLTTTGMAGWETPEGLWYINNRVANETMASGSIGAEHYFKLEDVLFTQYFTDVGHAIHFAWWRTPETIGRPGSHGCLNLLLDDARFCWEWAVMGTPVFTHYA